MELQQYVETIHQQLLVAADAGGDDARALAERLIAPLDAAVRLTLQDALAAAADEITAELAPGSVELRLRGRNPTFVVTAPPPVIDASDDNDVPIGRTWRGTVDDDGAMARINVRMQDQLKSLIDEAAAAAGLSINSWLVRAASAALERSGTERQRGPAGPRSTQQYTGWSR